MCRPDGRLTTSRNEGTAPTSGLGSQQVTAHQAEEFAQELQRLGSWKQVAWSLNDLRLSCAAVRMAP